MAYYCSSPAELPQSTGQVQHWGGLLGVSATLSLVEIAQRHAGLTVVWVPDLATAAELEAGLSALLPDAQAMPVMTFPDWETLPYDHFSPHQDIISARLKVLYALPSLQRGILLVPIATCMHRVCPTEHIQRFSFVLQTGANIELATVRDQLLHAGYQVATQVTEHGEFAIRGSLLDVFPMGADLPVRVDFFDTEVDSMRLFDPETQLSQQPVNQIECLPALEYPFDSDAIAYFRTRWRATFSGDPRHCPIYQDVSEGLSSPGLEYYLSLFFDTTATLLDYLPQQALVVRYGDIEAQAKPFWASIEHRYEQYRFDNTRPLLPPAQVFVPVTQLFEQAKRWPQIQLDAHPYDNKPKRFQLQTEALPAFGQARQALVQVLTQHRAQTGDRILLCAETPGRATLLRELLQPQALEVVEVTAWQDFVAGTAPYGLIVAPIAKGVRLPARQFAWITENDLFGRRSRTVRRRKGKVADPNLAFRSLEELTEGAPVVHSQHGIGRYRGLQLMQFGQAEGEFLRIEYARGDKIYVPVSDLHLVSRYSGVDPEHAPLHTLGSDKWQRDKKKAQQQVRDVAAELLQIYANREAKQGKAMQAPDLNYDKFVAAFPFAETPDQERAIDAVLADLQQSQPMDRVVCGDVGFGKTEVAMRAAFLAVANNQQVAMLVPTTLLAQQHYQSFLDRFADFPVTIEVLSRFKSAKEQREVVQKLATGRCDIVVGTHKLLQNGIDFNKLGLLIIDEEHRFGVRQKERFKALRAEVDILTLTATPIPRTLNMAMQGIRDLSIIITPPEKRLSVKTFVRDYNKALIVEAVQRELRRGGQVYFLHNEVDTIENCAAELSRWVPEARIVVAHGQMPERGLESVMSDFYHRRYNVLVCTTIIETGIDVPSANTIIINRADKLGLAQLHQLRGRVGRSHHQAYAFCLTPGKKSMTRDAIKRLEALENLDTLGAGFTLASQDLEIRGAGELLGDEQSGHMHAIGFSMYMEMLEQTVTAMKAGQTADLSESHDSGPQVDLQFPGLIPDPYLPDVQLRLVLYKRIASASHKAALDELKAEMIDRFGPLPAPTQDLFKLTEIKLQAAQLGIKAMKVGGRQGRIDFNQQPTIDPNKLIAMVQKEPNRFQFEGPHALKFQQILATKPERVQFVEQLFQALN